MSEQRPDLKAEMTSLKAGDEPNGVRDRARRAAESFATDGLRVDGVERSTEDSIIIEVDSASPTH